MSFTVTDAFVQQFSGNIRHLAQQGKSRLRGKVVEDTIGGDSAYFEQLGATSARKVTTRHADSPIANIPHYRRRLAVYDYDQGDLIDKLDKVKLLIDPTSEYALAIGNALRRGQDDEVIGCLFATAYTGHSGATAVTWPNGNAETTPTAPAGTQVGVSDWTYGNGSGNIGLTVSKLISASVALDQAEGDDEEERYFLTNAKGIGNLLSTTEATSADYASVKALVNGTINTFMGFNFIRSERIQTDASGYYRNAAWRKSGVGLGIAKDVEGNMAQRSDKRFAWYCYGDESIGASRLEESKVVEIKCV